MNLSIGTMEKQVINTVKEITGITVKNSEKNLLSREYRIPCWCFLYIFDKISTQYDIDFEKIISNKDFTVLTINNICSEILKCKQ